MTMNHGEMVHKFFRFVCTVTKSHSMADMLIVNTRSLAPFWEVLFAFAGTALALLFLTIFEGRHLFGVMRLGGGKIVAVTTFIGILAYQLAYRYISQRRES